MDSIEKILPIIFFVIWTIISISAKKKKNKPQAESYSRPASKQNSGTSGTPGRHAAENPKLPPGMTLIDKIKSQVKQIADELSEVESRPVLKTAAKEAKQSRPQVVKTALQKKASLIPSVNYTNAETVSGQVDSSLKQTPKHSVIKADKIQLPALHINRDSLKQAVIWSEIIGQPVSLKPME